VGENVASSDMFHIPAEQFEGLVDPVESVK
jgi:hypothetical protein